MRVAFFRFLQVQDARCSRHYTSARKIGMVRDTGRHLPWSVQGAGNRGIIHSGSSSGGKLSVRRRESWMRRALASKTVSGEGEPLKLLDYVVRK